MDKLTLCATVSDEMLSNCVNLLHSPTFGQWKETVLFPHESKSHPKRKGHRQYPSHVPDSISLPLHRFVINTDYLDFINKSEMIYYTTVNCKQTSSHLLLLHTYDHILTSGVSKPQQGGIQLISNWRQQSEVDQNLVRILILSHLITWSGHTLLQFVLQNRFVRPFFVVDLFHSRVTQTTCQVWENVPVNAIRRNDKQRQVRHTSCDRFELSFSSCFLFYGIDSDVLKRN